MGLCSSHAYVPAKFPIMKASDTSSAPALPVALPCAGGDPSLCASPLSYVTFSDINCGGDVSAIQTMMQWPDVCYLSADGLSNAKYSCKDGVLRMETRQGCNNAPIYTYSFDLVNGYSSCMKGSRYYCKF